MVRYAITNPPRDIPRASGVSAYAGRVGFGNPEFKRGIPLKYSGSSYDYGLLESVIPRGVRISASRPFRESVRIDCAPIELFPLALKEIDYLTARMSII